MIAIAIVGLVVPGFAVARALRSSVSLSLAAAFPLSALLITLAVIAYALAGICICFYTVLAAVGTVSLTALALCAVNRRRIVSPPDSDGEKSLTPRWLWRWTVVQVTLVLAGLLLRTSLYPLAGPDTPYRWEGLARLILEEESLSYYPPVTSEDYTKYTYPDGIPPLVSAVYWWLYAGWGSPCPRVTSLVIVLQAASCFGLVFCGARKIFGTIGALLSVLALSSSVLFLAGVAIGQETGYTALSVAGQLACALAAARNRRMAQVVLAGLFAALGALAREYGPALALCGLAALALDRNSRRNSLVFCLVASACGAPWYIRNWLITGNPMYAMDALGLGFSSNAVHVGLHEMYRERFGLHTLSFAAWLHVALRMAIGAALVVLLGLPGLRRSGRYGLALGLSVALLAVLWLWSIPYTIAGVDHSMRVLTPAWVVLAIAAGAMAPKIFGPSPRASFAKRATLFAGFGVGGLMAIMNCWLFPVVPGSLSNMVLGSRDFPRDALRNGPAMAQLLERTDLPSGRVLTDDCYLALALQRESRFRPMMAWSPEIAFVLDSDLPPAEVRRRLRDQEIWFVALFPDNARYFAKFLFFSEDARNWIPLAPTGDRRQIYYLPP